MPQKSLNILVAGGFDLSDPKALKLPSDDIIAFCQELGSQIIIQGHHLLTGCQTELDKTVAESASQQLIKQDQTHDIEKRITSYILKGIKPSHDTGALMSSNLTDWGIGNLQLEPPEIINKADIVILIGGFNGTFIAANWARIVKKPILPFVPFGGASEKIYHVESRIFMAKYADKINMLEFEKVLKSLSKNWRKLATQTVNLAEKVVSPSDVFVIMSFTPRKAYQDLYKTLQEVCNSFGYRAMRVDESNLFARIVPEITKQIRECAFVIADVTELKANVYYELGYADGFGKPMILTAEKGAKIAFDTADIPIIFWNDWQEFEKQLTQKVKEIGSWQGRV